MTEKEKPANISSFLYSFWKCSIMVCVVYMFLLSLGQILHQKHQRKLDIVPEVLEDKE